MPLGTPAFFYVWPELNKRLAVLCRLIQKGDALVLVTGEKDAGKSSLLNFLREKGNWRPCSILVQTEKPDAPIDFGVVHKREAYFAPSGPEGEDRVLILDDAHLLAEKEFLYVIQQCFGAQTGHRVQRVILFGEPGLPSRVRRLCKNAGWELNFSEIQIPRMGHSETDEYLRRFWAARAGEAPFPFSRKEITRLFEASGGVVGHVAKEAFQLYEQTDTLIGFSGRFQSRAGAAAILAAALFFCLAVAFHPNLPGGGISPPVSRKGNQPGSPLAASPGGVPVRGILGAAWIEKQLPSDWTIEAIRLFNLKSVHRFSNMYGLNTPVACFRLKPSGPYVVLVGVFPDMARAQEAAMGMSKALKGYHLLPRRFGEVQKDLP